MFGFGLRIKQNYTWTNLIYFCSEHIAFDRIMFICQATFQQSNCISNCITLYISDC